MKVTGAEALMKTLVDLGVDTMFGYPGGAIMPAYDALYGYTDKIRHVLVRHEQGASHAAEGYARMTGKPGVCMVTSGPGATNLVTGIADAMMDSVPLLCITGQVHQALIGTDAFQETDIIGITTPITKWNYQVTSAEEVAEAIVKGWHIAMNGRPGPVLVDITKNAQIEETEYRFPTDIKIEGFQPVLQPNPRQIQAAADLINTAEKPFLVFGHGVLIAKAEKELMAFVEKSGVPVANTLHGLSGFPSAHRQYVGWVGMHGNYSTNILTNEADVLIAVGMRFDDRVTGRLKDYAKRAKVIHIDIDPAELNKNVPAAVPIVADAKRALAELAKVVEARDHSAWIARFRELEQQELEQIIRPQTEPAADDPKVRMAEVVHILSQKTKGQAVIVPDVGQHQMIAARYYKFSRTDSFISSGGAGTMGFGLPAAMGAKIAAPDREVIAVLGDGGFQMTSQELMTISAEEIPVKIIILNNNYLGMVRQWQQLFFDRRYSFVDIKNPDFIKMAESYYIPAEKVTDRSSIGPALDRLLASKGPRLVEVVCEKEENVFPMIPSGASIDEIRLK